MKQHWRFAVAALLLAGTGVLLHARNGAEIIPKREPLSSFPRTLSGWQSSDIPITKDVLDVLGPGDFLLRDYYREANSGEGISLFIAYFPSQRAGDTIHSPKNCLPGGGWTPVKEDRITVQVPGQAPLRVNRYLIAKGDERQLLLYWYLAHNRTVASEYAAKSYLIADSIRMHRTDGSLIRVSTPLAPDETVATAQNQLISFTANILPRMQAYVPR